MSNLNNVFARQPKAAQAPASAHAWDHTAVPVQTPGKHPFSRLPHLPAHASRPRDAPVTYGQILVEQVRGSYDAQVRTSSVILITISLLSIFFCFIILSGACLPAAAGAGTRRSPTTASPSPPLKLARTTFYVVLACFVVDLATLIAFIVWLFG